MESDQEGVLMGGEETRGQEKKSGKGSKESGEGGGVEQEGMGGEETGR